MAWYQCSCGFLTEQSPQHGEAVVSVYHLHSASRLDGRSAVVRMEQLQDPIPTCGTQVLTTELNSPVT